MKVGNAILLTMFDGQVPIVIGRGDISPFYIVEDAQEPDLLLALQWPDGTIPDTAGASGTLTMIDKDGNVLINAGAMTVAGVDTDAGEIKYAWGSGEAAPAGIHRGRATVTLSGGQAHPIYETVEIHVAKKFG